MYLTEEEAKGKMCPVVVRDFQTSHFDRCKISECMAWREGRKIIWDEHYKAERSIPAGYCGLAGKPD